MDEVVMVIGRVLEQEGSVIVRMANENMEVNHVFDDMDAAKRFQLGRTFRVKATSFKVANDG